MSTQSETSIFNSTMSEMEAKIDAEEKAKEKARIMAEYDNFLNRFGLTDSLRLTMRRSTENLVDRLVYGRKETKAEAAYPIPLEEQVWSEFGYRRDKDVDFKPVECMNGKEKIKKWLKTMF
ncbi:hypothetical protein C8Q75DRAFT_737912 [Abortiporus biennis]|nr:hypothetical protein C8Q75DRAFT_737912 [Abortiporus biennis]